MVLLFLKRNHVTKHYIYKYIIQNVGTLKYISNLKLTVFWTAFTIFSSGFSLLVSATTKSESIKKIKKCFCALLTVFKTNIKGSSRKYLRRKKTITDTPTKRRIKILHFVLFFFYGFKIYCSVSRTFRN